MSEDVLNGFNTESTRDIDLSKVRDEYVAAKAVYMENQKKLDATFKAIENIIGKISPENIIRLSAYGVDISPLKNLDKEKFKTDRVYAKKIMDTIVTIILTIKTIVSENA